MPFWTESPCFECRDIGDQCGEMNLQSPYPLTRLSSRQWAWTWQSTPRNWALRHSGKVHLCNGKFQASLSSGRAARCNRDHCSPEWPLGSQVLHAYCSPMAFLLFLLTFCPSFFFCRLRGETKFHRVLFFFFFWGFFFFWFFSFFLE